MVPAMRLARLPWYRKARGSSVRALRALNAIAFVLALAIASTPARSASATRSRSASPAAATVLVRTGDPAPAQARVPSQIGGPIVVTGAGGMVFRDFGGAAVYLRDAGSTTVLAFTGEQFPGGTIGAIVPVGASPDGSVLLLAWLTAGGQALLRVPPGGGAPSVLLSAEQALSLADPGGVYFGASFWVDRVAIDGVGRVILNLFLYPSGSAMIRIPPSGPAEILLRNGDPLGGETIQSLLATPGVSPSGKIAFSAQLASGAQVVATLTPGSPPVVLRTLPPHPPTVGGPLYGTTPAINDAGVVAYYWVGDAGGQNLERFSGGDSRTIVASGSPAPGGGVFTAICCSAPSIDASGGIVFGGYKLDAPSVGIYRFTDATQAIVAAGDVADDGTVIGGIDLSTAPALASDGTLLFSSYDGSGVAGLFAFRGTIHREVRAGDPVAGPARFVFFQGGAGPFIGPGFGGSGPIGGIGNPRPPAPILNALLPNLGGGPYLSPAGRMVFDAGVTGGGRGLFLREPGGGIAALALDGDPAPGGGHFDGRYFSYHSMNDAGAVAFIAAAPDGPTGSSLFLAYGPAAGPLTRLVGSGDAVPGSTALVSGFQPPSRVGADGSVAIPLFLSDGTVTLAGWDGTRLVHVAGPGDVIPGDGAIQSIITGVTGRLLPPLLDDAGGVTFGAITESGGQALYRAPLREGGFGSAARVIGERDFVEGGQLGPFVPQILDGDATGRLAFQTPAPGGPGSTVDAATYLQEPGAPTVRVTGPGDQLPVAGAVHAVVPHLAVAGNDRLVHEVAGPTLVASRPAPTPFSPGHAIPGAHQAGAFQTTILAGAGLPSPDGGSYLPRPYLYPDPPPPPSRPIRPSPNVRRPPAPAMTTHVTTDRLASDGDHLVAWTTGTTNNPQEIILFDLNVNQPPVARSDTPRVVECSGPEGAAVTLDGSSSFDPEGGPVTLEWSGPFGTVTGPRPIVSLPFGTTTINLTASDEQGASATTTVDVLVRDSVAPAVSAAAAPAVIWPHNGRMVAVSVLLSARDLCDPNPIVVLTGVGITDKKPGDPSADIAGADVGTDDRIFQVRATRYGAGDGRTYTATYQVTDRSGNSATAVASVVVPINRR